MRCVGVVLALFLWCAPGVGVAAVVFFGWGGFGYHGVCGFYDGYVF